MLQNQVLDEMEQVLSSGFGGGDRFSHVVVRGCEANNPVKLAEGFKSLGEGFMDVSLLIHRF